MVNKILDHQNLMLTIGHWHDHRTLESPSDFRVLHTTTENRKEINYFISMIFDVFILILMFNASYSLKKDMEMHVVTDLLFVFIFMLLC